MTQKEWTEVFSMDNNAERDKKEKEKKLNLLSPTHELQNTKIT